jgi:hypothetical protein
VSLKPSSDAWLATRTFKPNCQLEAGSVSDEKLAMLACYWNLLSVVRMMPEKEGEELVKSLESKIRAAGTDGITRKMLQRSVRHCRGQDFKSAIETIENRGLAVFQDAEAKNKAVSRRFWAPELQPKPGTRPKEL